MAMNRKEFIKTAGVLAGALSSVSRGNAQDIHDNLDPDRVGVLSDLTLCIGCRKCEYACSKNHGLPYDPIQNYDDPAVMEDFRRPTDSKLTVVNRYPKLGLENNPLDVKVQCMHCEHHSAYDFTVIPVIATLKQYIDGSIRKPGLWMMGHIVDPDRLLDDMRQMGVSIQTLVAKKTAG